MRKTKIFLLLLCLSFICLLTSCTKEHVHKYGEWVTVKEATCAEEGLQERSCYCLEKETQAIPPTDEHVRNDTVACNWGQTCKVCNTVLRQPGPHEYGEPTVITPVTCKTNGEQKQVCKYCGDTVYKKLLATGHRYGDFVTVKEATCSEPGLRERHCEKCDDKISETVVASHTGEWLIVKEPTKSEDGAREIDCTSCQKKITETLYAYGSSGLAYWLDASNKICKITGIGTCTDADVVIPKYIEGYTVTVIGDGAFRDCKTMTSLSIPSTVTKIGDWVVSGATNLTTLYYNSSCQCSFSNFGNAPITKIVYGGTYVGMITTTVEEVVIIGNPTQIENEAFWGSALTSIVIPEGVTSIGYRAFENCSNLTSITIPSSVTSIGYSAFSGCRSLTEIVIPEGVTELGNMLFFACESLTSVVIPSSVTKIDGSAFSGCCNLTEIILPEGVTQIVEYAFSSCKALTAFNVPDGITEIENGMFMYCEAMTDVVIPASVKRIGVNAFYQCTNLKSITFRGTKAEWEAIVKGTDWNQWSGLKTVTCSDGVITL